MTTKPYPTFSGQKTAKPSRKVHLGKVKTSHGGLVTVSKLAEYERRLKKLEKQKGNVFTYLELETIKINLEKYTQELTPTVKTNHIPEIAAAKRKLELQEAILANVAVVDQSDACDFLSLSKSNPSAALKRRDAELLRFIQNGKVVYPLFQFDIDNRRVFPAMIALKELKPRDWSDYRLLNWLSRPHMDFDGIPYKYLSDEESIVAAFKREIEPQEFG